MDFVLHGPQAILVDSETEEIDLRRLTYPTLFWPDGQAIHAAASARRRSAGRPSVLSLTWRRPGYRRCTQKLEVGRGRRCPSLFGRAPSPVVVFRMPPHAVLLLKLELPVPSLRVDLALVAVHAVYVKALRSTGPLRSCTTLGPSCGPSTGLLTCCPFLQCMKPSMHML
ncbi:hypothetical protein M513_07187 [Trichuris suis]|uniref:Uncharacterized protein n=1 Tax=Trichuris suis TaxID=68888 RepID=A0A085M3R2_9BILA|nr:hypothetical protein M513_07187 [Trichuris suis]